MSVLDIRKVMPASETILTMDEDVVSDAHVTAVCLLEKCDGSQLFIGTSKGLLIVAHAHGVSFSICIEKDSFRCNQSVHVAHLPANWSLCV